MDLFKPISFVRRSALAGLALIAALAACGKKPAVSVVRPDPLPTASQQLEDDDKSGTSTVSVSGDGAATAPTFGPVRFEFDSSVISEDGRRELQRLATWLEKNQVHVTIEGHADERGTTEYNVALGERRAAAISDYLTRLGLDRSRFTTISYGEERPAQPGDDESAWAVNRRGELRPDP